MPWYKVDVHIIGSETVEVEAWDEEEAAREAETQVARDLPLSAYSIDAGNVREAQR